jgi:glycosyltransferase involved in cell wall biosynthesis
MAKQKNDVAFVLIGLKKRGVRLKVITSKSLELKGIGQLPSSEDMDGVSVHRLYKSPSQLFRFPYAKIHEVLRIAQSLAPDIIFCSHESNMRLALIIKRYCKVPIVCLVEDAGRIFTGEAYTRLKTRFTMGLLGIPGGSKYWSWLCRKASTLVTCHPRDKWILDRLSQYKTPVCYIPWPTHVPEGFTSPCSREKYRGVYIGSLFPFKNTQEFARTLPRILQETHTREFIVVGPGPHSSIVKKLEQETGGAVKYIRELSREKALELIASSHYAYTPVVRGGWGFIGDCWSMKTPIVMTHNDDYVIDRENALVAENEEELVKNINILYDNPELVKRLQENGYDESKKRKAEVVADELFRLFASLI